MIDPPSPIFSVNCKKKKTTYKHNEKKPHAFENKRKVTIIHSTITVRRSIPATKFKHTKTIFTRHDWCKCLSSKFKFEFGNKF